MKQIALNGRDVQAFLNGFFCIFKPRDVSVSALQNAITQNICAEANALDEIVVPEIDVPVVRPHRRSGALVVVGTRKQLDYVQHPLMSGKVFRKEDIVMEPLHYLEPTSSGVCLFGINDGCDELDGIRERAWLNEYDVEGQLGIEKNEHQIRASIIAKARHDHVKAHAFRKLFSRLKFQYKKLAYELSNVEPGSQAAFELARRGAPRPRIPGTPVIYDIALRYFAPPYFRMGVQVTGENDIFLRELVHEVGCCVESLAAPRRLRRIREGPFMLEHALLDKQLRLAPILRNIQMCNKIVKLELAKHSDVVEIKKSEDVESRSLLEEFGLIGELAKLEEAKDCLTIPWGRTYD